MKEEYGQDEVKHCPHHACIYAMVSGTGGEERYYIGSTNNFQRRVRNHFWMLRNNCGTKNMQNSYDSGIEFKARILEIIDHPSLDRLQINENMWIGKIKKEFGERRVYNKFRACRTNVTSETKAKLSKARVGKKTFIKNKAAAFAEFFTLLEGKKIFRRNAQEDFRIFDRKQKPCFRKTSF